MTVWFDKSRQHWRYDFWHRGQRYHGYSMVQRDGYAARPAANKTEAKDAELAEKARVKSKPSLPTVSQGAPGEITFAQMLANYVARRKGSRNWENIRKYVAELLAWFGPDRAGSEINGPLIWRYINEFSRLQPHMIWAGGSKKTGRGKPRYKIIEGKFRSDSTTNRYLEALRTALGEAHDDRDPHTQRRLLLDVPDVPELDEPDDMPNPVPVRILASIIKTGPRHLAKAILLTVAFGFRKMEALTIGPNHIDWDIRGIRLASRETKGKRGEFLPASDEQMAMLKILADEAKAAGVDTLVFYLPPGKNSKARSIVDISHSWRSELKRHGVAGKYVFHNTKATFVSLMAELASGAVTQNWARHKSFSTTQRYINLADAPKRAAGEALVERLANAGFLLPAPSPTQKSHTTKKASGE